MWVCTNCKTEQDSLTEICLNCGHQNEEAIKRRREEEEMQKKRHEYETLTNEYDKRKVDLGKIANKVDGISLKWLIGYVRVFIFLVFLMTCGGIGYGAYIVQHWASRTPIKGLIIAGGSALLGFLFIFVCVSLLKLIRHVSLNTRYDMLRVEVMKIAEKLGQLKKEIEI